MLYFTLNGAKFVFFFLSRNQESGLEDFDQ